MINLEIPSKFKAIVNQAYQVGSAVMRPVSRKYDKQEHDYPVELDALATLMDALNDSGMGAGAGTQQLKMAKDKSDNEDEVVNGANLSTILGLIELCWGDVGLALSLPRQGLGNAAISAVANEEQMQRFGKLWASMAITEPGAGSDSASIRTTAMKDGDEYVINGEKIYVTSGQRSNAVVVWANVDPSVGRAGIKSFVVEKGTPGMEVVRLEEKLGIKASDTATIMFTNCRVPKENLLGSPEVNTQKGFGGVMQTFDNTRPVVAAMAVGLSRAALEKTHEILGKAGVTIDYKKPALQQSAMAAELMHMQAELESARLLTMKSAWMADNGIPNSKEASMAKAKAGRVANYITLKCVELCGAAGYQEVELLEKWARDSKILDIFEGTQQIQLLIIARRLLNKSSSQLK